MAQPATVRNVLTTLDERAPSALYWQLTVLATLGGFLFGYDTSNIGSALNFVPYNLHGLALGYLVSGASLGAAAGAIVAGPVADPVRPQETADRGRGPLRRRGDLVGRRPGRRGAAVRPDADRAGDRGGLGDRHRLHRRVRAEGPARVADDAAAVDDHRRDPHLIHRGAGHLQRVPGQRRLVRVAAGPGPGGGARPDRAGAAHPDARIAPLAAPARPLRPGPQG